MLPDIATMYAAGAGPGALDLDFWRDVYGFSYRCCTLFDCMGPLRSTSTNCLPVSAHHTLLYRLRAAVQKLLFCILGIL